MLLPAFCIIGKVDLKRLDKANWIYLDTLEKDYCSDRSIQRDVEIMSEAIFLTKGENKYLKKQLEKFRTVLRKQ